MTNSLPCPNCGHQVSSTDYVCPGCGTKIITTLEKCTINDETALDMIVSDLENGESVRIINEEHPYHNEIALVCDKKHLFVRLEVNGYKIWMPNEWVERYV